jgi:DNA-binding GntR family transcriptional regulator
MEEHRRLIEAFRARDSGRAERLMQTHLQKQCQALVSYYAEKGKKAVHPVE